MTQPEKEIRSQLIKKINEIKKRDSDNVFRIATLGKKFTRVNIPVAKTGGYAVSNIGLKFGDLVYIAIKRGGKKVYESFAVYVGMGKDDAIENDQEEKHWFLAEHEDAIHYYANLLAKADLARLGIRKVVEASN